MTRPLPSPDRSPRAARRHGPAAAVALLLALVTLAGLGGSPALGATPTAATWAAPHPVRLIGGPSSPAVAAWGVAYHAGLDELLVGDYLSNQVRRYGRDGSYHGDLANPGATTGGVPSALAVDDRDGTFYLVVTGSGRTSRTIRVYGPDARFRFDFDTLGDSAWAAVAPDGDLWVPEAFGRRRLTRWHVDSAAATATLVTTVDRPGSGPGQFGSLTGVAVDAAGNVYVADPGNHVIHSFTPDGTWRHDLGSADMFPGDLRGLALDRTAGQLYVANSERGTIDVLDLATRRLVRSFAGLGEAPDQLIDGARQLTLGPDGHVWAADYGSRRVVEYDAAGALVASLPSPSLPPDPAGISSARGMAVDPRTGDVLLADAWNQRVLRYSPDGALLASVGRRGTYGFGGMNYPKAVAVDPATGNVWVANYEGAPGVVVYSADLTKEVLRLPSVPQSVSDLEIVGDTVWAVVHDRQQVLTFDRTTGARTGTCCDALKVGALRGIAVDPVTRNVWLTTDDKALAVVVSPTGSVLARLRLSGRGWGVALAGDVAYVADTVAGTVVAFSRTTYAKLGTVGQRGMRWGQLGRPSAVAIDPSGRLLVSEDGNNRIQVFTSEAAPTQEAVAPTVTVTAAAAPGSQVVVTGYASDASPIARVEVTVVDRSTGLTFSAPLNSWLARSPYWNPAIVWGTTQRTWRFTVPGTLPHRTYTVRVRAVDCWGNTSAVRSMAVPVA